VFSKSWAGSGKESFLLICLPASRVRTSLHMFNQLGLAAAAFVRQPTIRQDRAVPAAASGKSSTHAEPLQYPLPTHAVPSLQSTLQRDFPIAKSELQKHLS
jgi:hypothetical protein